jgi:hypothetical protein
MPCWSGCGLISDDRRYHLAAVRRAARLGSRGPGDVLLTVTRRGRTAWVPAVIGPDGRTRWRGEPCRTRLAAQASAEGQVTP